LFDLFDILKLSQFSEGHVVIPLEVSALNILALIFVLLCEIKEMFVCLQEPDPFNGLLEKAEIAAGPGASPLGVRGEANAAFGEDLLNTGVIDARFFEGINHLDVRFVADARVAVFIGPYAYVVNDGVVTHVGFERFKFQERGTPSGLNGRQVSLKKGEPMVEAANSLDANNFLAQVSFDLVEVVVSFRELLVGIAEYVLHLWDAAPHEYG
jgi:hypothetical protein